MASCRRPFRSFFNVLVSIAVLTNARHLKKHMRSQSSLKAKDSTGIADINNCESTITIDSVISSKSNLAPNLVYHGSFAECKHHCTCSAECIGFSRLVAALPEELSECWLKTSHIDGSTVPRIGWQTIEGCMHTDPSCPASADTEEGNDDSSEHQGALVSEKAVIKSIEPNDAPICQALLFEGGGNLVDHFGHDSEARQGTFDPFLQCHTFDANNGKPKFLCDSRKDGLGCGAHDPPITTHAECAAAVKDLMASPPVHGKKGSGIDGECHWRGYFTSSESYGANVCACLKPDQDLIVKGDLASTMFTITKATTEPANETPARPAGLWGEWTVGCKVGDRLARCCEKGVKVRVCECPDDSDSSCDHNEFPGEGKSPTCESLDGGNEAKDCVPTEREGTICECTSASA